MPKIKDTDFIAQYIRAIENPDSIGYRNGKWYQSTRRGDDPNNRGFGVDIMYNKEANKLTENRKGRWLTEEEERNLRNSHIDYSNMILNKWTPKVIAQYPSENKQAVAAGMIYRGDGVKKIIKNPDLKDAYFSGSDEDFQNAVESYYKKKGLRERAKNHKNFMDNYTPGFLTPTEWGKDAFNPSYNLHDSGGFIQRKEWPKLSTPEKADIMRMAVSRGIYNLEDIKGIYNEFANGGNIHIDPSKKGTFTAAATKHGKSVQAFASQVLAHPENYSPVMRKKANFARNAAKWHSLGGPIENDRVANYYGLGDYIKRGWEALRNSNAVAAIAENPAVMMAAGWRIDKNGKAIQDKQNDRDVKQLRENLATLGEGAISAPTTVGDIEATLGATKAVYNAVRHPIKTIKAAKKGKNNVNALVDRIIQGRDAAVKYKSSPEYKNLAEQARQESVLMGTGDFDPKVFTHVNEETPNYNFDFSKSLPDGRIFGGQYRIVDNTIDLDPDYILSTETPFHEHLHWQRVGTPSTPLQEKFIKAAPSDEYGLFQDFYNSPEYSSYKNAKEYLREKTNRVLYDDAPKDGYLRDSRELVANGLDAGRHLGLEPFTPYPGYGETLKYINPAREYKQVLEDVKAATPDEVENFWKILTGQYIPAAGAVIVPTAIQKRK